MAPPTGQAPDVPSLQGPQERAERRRVLGERIDESIGRCGDVHCEAKEQTPMPAKDRYHDAVERALQKDGWTILREQVELIVPPRRLWIDLRAAEACTLVILVEVKGFEAARSGSVPLRWPSDNASCTKELWIIWG
jgi:hypothetical protein